LKGNYVTLNSSFGLGIQALQVWIKFRAVKFLARRLRVRSNPLIENLLNMSLKEIYRSLLILRDYSRRMNQPVELPDINLVG